jgi:glycosyltransferase involved in cell wall biosynthesis
MAMGLPVIGTFHGGIPELVKDGISAFLSQSEMLMVYLKS